MYLYHSKFADPAWLEKMLFGRREVTDWLEKIALLFVESGKATHSLLIGNRGMGKSHVIGTLYHRLARTEAVRQRVVIAYMEEAPYGIADYLDLLRRILKAIIQRESDAISKQRLQSAHQTLVATGPKQRVDTAQRILLEHLAGRRLLLLVENLNQIFDALGEEGQSRWRDFLQANDNTMICATSQAIFSDVQQRSKPFFGFFHVTYLQKLSYEEARDLLLTMAEMQKNAELVAYVDTPEGEAKLRAIFELTEGNHRLLVAFFDFFMAEFRAELSKSFLRTVDQLKPYYESFLKLLPPQQQKIVQFLVQERIPQTGRTIADNCFLPINGLSSQMSDLQRLGYVRNDRQGRDAYYEITEPMLRMCLESNENTDGILSIFVDFLGSLYSVQDLKFHSLRFHLMADISNDLGLQPKMAEEAYLYKKAAKRYDSNWEPDTQELFMAREASMVEQEQTVWRMVEDSEFDACKDQFYNLIDEKRHREAESLLEKTFPNRLSHYYWRILGYLLHDEGRKPEAEAAYRKSIEIKATDDTVWNNLGALLYSDNRMEEAEDMYRKSIAIKPTSRTWRNLGNLLKYLNRIKEAENAYEKALEINPIDADAWRHYGALLRNIDRYEEAEAAFKKALEIDPSALPVWGALVELANKMKQGDRGEELLGMFIEKYPGDESHKSSSLMALELLLWSRGNNGIFLNCMSHKDIQEKGENMLTFLLMILSGSKDFGLLSVLKNPQLSIFIKKCKKNTLPRALKAVTKFLLGIEDGSISSTQLHTFHAALAEAFGHKTSMHYPLKFLHLGIRHVKEQDPKALLELTLEERRVFEREILGLSK